MAFNIVVAIIAYLIGSINFSVISALSVFVPFILYGIPITNVSMSYSDNISSSLLKTILSVPFLPNCF